MLDIGWDEMLLVAMIALLVIGPKDLPKVLRTASQWVRKARSLAGEFQRGVDDMVRETELHDLKKEVERVADTNTLRREIENTIDPTGSIAKSLEPPKLASLDVSTPALETNAEVKPEPEATPPQADSPPAEPRRPPEP